MIHTVSRSNLVVGDPLRNWAWLWSIDRLTPGTSKIAPIELVGRAGTYPTTRPLVGWPQAWFEEYLHGGFRIANDTPPGEYEVRANGMMTGCMMKVANLAVLPRLNKILPSYNRTTNDIEEAAKYGDVGLLPGEYWIDRPLTLPPGTTIRGYGAVLRRVPDRNATSYQSHMVHAVDNLTFEGIQFHPIDYLMFGDHAGAGTIFHQCEFVGGQLGHWLSPELLVHQCTFTRSSAGRRSGGMFADCRWVGHSMLNHAFLAESGDRLCLLGCTFDGTDRGPVLRSGWGSCDDALLAGIECRGINRTPNGNELFTTEGAGLGVNRSMFLRWRAYGCDGDFAPWNAPFNKNLIWDMSLDGSSIAMGGKAPQTANSFRDIELRGGGITFGDQARSNDFDRVACVDFRPSRANQVDSSPARYERLAVIDGGNTFDSNIFTQSTVRGESVPMKHRGVAWRWR